MQTYQSTNNETFQNQNIIAFHFEGKNNHWSFETRKQGVYKDHYTWVKTN